MTGATSDGLTQVLVNAAMDGVTVVRGRSIDMTRLFGPVSFDNVQLRAGSVVGAVGAADRAVEKQLGVAIALQCAEMVGVAERTLDFTLEYGQDRIAFGRPILSFQALKHRIADMTVLLEGSKMWSSNAYRADYGLCLCRSDWDAPKHRGLSMIAVPLQGTTGVTIERITAASGLSGDFCLEFFDDVALPVENLLGEEGKGWGVAQTLLVHERNAVAGIGYGYLGGSERVPGPAGDARSSVPALAAAAARRGVDGAVAAMVADAYIHSVVVPLTSLRIVTGMRLGTHKGQWGAVSKLQKAVSDQRTWRTTLATLGADGVMCDRDEIEFDNPGTAWLGCRGNTIAGGSNEMRRNIIRERLLGLPREPLSDRDVPFNEALRRQGAQR